jgi:hypothetical protein
MQMQTPILLFTYNRLAETKQTILNLKKNIGAKDSELIIYSDAAKDESAIYSVQAVRDYLKTISGFKSVKIIERSINFGLANSIITGVTEVIENYGQVIVLEDDLITSNNFLLYMNAALNFYKENDKIWSISGYTPPIDYPAGYCFDSAFGIRASSWGWATWSDRWKSVDWSISDYHEFLKDRSAQKGFNRGGSDMCKMLNEQKSGKINSWAVRFCYSQFRQEKYDVIPTVSKIQNIGFASDATHTKGMYSRFTTPLDVSETTQFKFATTPSIIPTALKQFQKLFSVSTRLKYKILRHLS